MLDTDVRRLQQAKNLLENPGLASKITAYIGMPVEKALDRLPQGWSVRIAALVRNSLEKALVLAVSTLSREVGRAAPRDRVYRWATALSGGVGGAFGMAMLPLELPVTTVIMLRAIADIARCEGEDIRTIEGRLACLEVFALGGKAEEGSASETGYYAARTLLAREVSLAARHIAEKGLAKEGTPVLARLVAVIASRFSPMVAQKVAAAAVPVVGAAGGAWINIVFMNHYQKMARAHFLVRRLERIYGRDEVQRQYVVL